ncbi:response regulator transcription factor [Candidatus Omnitrophota bacterium]
MNAKKKILVVDDDQAVGGMLKKFLSKKGYEAIAVESGKEALKKLKSEKPNIILLDIRMPEMDGIEVLKRIRDIDRNVGVIMITAVKEDEIGRRCMELGAYDYITKPFDLDYMENVLMVKLLVDENN